MGISFLKNAYKYLNLYVRNISKPIKIDFKPSKINSLILQKNRLMKPITDISQLDLNKKYTYADYLTWHFNERVELIKGWIYKMSPAPKTKHQSASGEIFYVIKHFINQHNKKCKIFDAPFDVRLIKKKGERIKK